MAGSDLTGSLAALAGVLLIVLAGAILVIHRRTNPRQGVGRWLVRGIAATVAIVAVPVVLIPLSASIVLP